MPPAFADDGKHFVETHSATLTPPRISVCAPGGTCQKIWEARSVADYDLIAPKIMRIQSGRWHGAVWLSDSAAPCGCEPEIPIPLIVYIYGGPAEQIVRDAWGGTNALVPPDAGERRLRDFLGR